MLLSTLLLTGCLSATEDHFAASYAQVTCQRLQECFRGVYESQYDDMADCVDDYTDAYDDAMEAADDAGCDFDQDKAGECLTETQKISCGDYYEDGVDECTEVMDDCGDGIPWWAWQ